MSEDKLPSGDREDEFILPGDACPSCGARYAALSQFDEGTPLEFYNGVVAEIEDLEGCALDSDWINATVSPETIYQFGWQVDEAFGILCSICRLDLAARVDPAAAAIEPLVTPLVARAVRAITPALEFGRRTDFEKRTKVPFNFVEAAHRAFLAMGPTTGARLGDLMWAEIGRDRARSYIAVVRGSGVEARLIRELDAGILWKARRVSCASGMTGESGRVPVDYQTAYVAGFVDEIKQWHAQLAGSAK